MRHLCLLILCLGGLTFLTAQSAFKFEREYRLSVDEVPEAARAFLTNAIPQAKVRWYGEQSQDGSSIEAKIKKADVQYSIEFDTTGRVEDVEVLTPFPALPTAIQDSICGHLNSQYTRFRLMRIQRQWTATDPGALQALVRSGTSDTPYHERYEIVLKASTPAGVVWYEYLFGETGQVLRKQQIVFRNTDNLDY